jgi:beta-galactosidase
LRDLIGVRVEEFIPLAKGDKVTLDDGTEGQTWSEVAHPIDAEVVASFKEYPGTGAVFHRKLGEGHVWYLSTRPADLDPLFDRLGVTADFPGTPPGLELVRRRHEDGRGYLFAINHGEEPVKVPATGRNLLTGKPWAPMLSLKPGECAVIRE